MNRRGELLRLLADGALHSGEELAATLAVTRAAVWKQLHALSALGLELVAEPRRGYRLSRPLDLLDVERIRRALPDDAAGRLRHLAVHPEIASTNDELLRETDLPPGRFDAALAEFQTAGRGRRGRTWLAPYASGLCLSLSWNYRDAPAALPGLSLAAGVATLRALAGRGLRGVQLKWPNDLLHERRKLGGILIDLRAEAGGPAYVVVGLGINLRLPPETLARLAEQGVEATDLAATGLRLPERNVLAAALISELAAALEEFGQRGLEAFAEEWCEADALRDQSVRIEQAGRLVAGIARGIDADGALLVDAGGARLRYTAGDVSLRPLP